MKKELSIIALLILGALPLTFFGSTLSQEITSEYNTSIYYSEKNVTIHQWNPLLGNQYVILVGDTFYSYTGYINGIITIFDKSTGVNSSYPFFIDATSSFVETQYAAIPVILTPGEYIIYHECDVSGIEYHIVARGWLMNLSDIDQINIFQYIAIGLSVLFLLALIIVSVKINRR